MSNICIIGTEGAGKTVFVTVLAHRYSKPEAGEPWLEFKNGKTNLYVAEIWDTLTVDHDWPPSTPAGKKRMLKWGFHTPNGTEHPMTVLDAPGQDIRTIFTVEDDSELLGDQQELKQHIQDAEVIVYLVNLSEIIRAKRAVERANFENPILTFVQWAKENGKRFALVISQHDQVKELLSQEGISKDDPWAALYECYPQVWGVLQELRKTRGDDDFYLGYLAAVADTEYVENSNGRASLRPRRNFSSAGMRELVKWLSDTCDKENDISPILYEEGMYDGNTSPYGENSQTSQNTIQGNNTSASKSSWLPWIVGYPVFLVACFLLGMTIIPLITLLKLTIYELIYIRFF